MYKIKNLIKYSIFTSFILGIFILSSCANILPNQVHISTQTMQDKLQEQFPRQKNVLSVYQLNLSNPKIFLDETNKRVKITLDTKINSPLMEAINGSVVFSSSLALDDKKQNLLLKDPMVDELNFNEIDKSTKQFLMPALKIAATSLLQDYPIYKIKSQELKLLGTQITPTDIIIKEDGIDIKIDKN